jgi:hypothetical protein
MPRVRLADNQQSQRLELKKRLKEISPDKGAKQ